MQPLNNAQIRYLRSLGHALRPVIMVGGKGVTPALLAELGLALDQHELIKVKVAAGDRDLRDQWIGQLIADSQARLVQRIGNIALLYRRNPDRSQIVLPQR